MAASSLDEHKNVTPKRNKDRGDKGQQIDPTVATIYKLLINRGVQEKLNQSQVSLFDNPSKIQTRTSLDLTEKKMERDSP